MNHWNYEFMAEYHRQDILEQAEQFRLERFSVQSRVYRPRLLARTMYSFANWMISTGKNLRKHYEVPCVDCPTPSGSFAQ